MQGKCKMQLDKFCADHHKYDTSLPFVDIWSEEGDLELPFLIENAKGQGMIHRDSIIVLQGKPKQGKSTAALCFAMALLAGEFIGLKAHESGCDVLWIDTEMGIRECKKRLRLAMESVGLDQKRIAGRLKFLSLKSISKEGNKRTEAVERAVREVCPDFVVLDGVADLVRDVNKFDECADVMERLGMIVERHHIALLTLIHENKQDEKARGHLGSVTDQKAYELYAVKNGKADYLCGRGEPCEGFSFSFADGGIPAPAADVLRNEWTEALQKWAEVFKALPDGGRNASGYRYSELWKAYRDFTSASESSSKRAIKQSVEDGILIQEGEGKEVRYRYAFPLTPTEFEDEVL